MSKAKAETQKEDDEDVEPTLEVPAKDEKDYASRVLPARKKAYAAHIETMDIDPALRGWAERMAARFGPTVKVWHQDLTWLPALLVARYGEAVYGVDAKGKMIRHWPRAFTIADYGTATMWESGEQFPLAIARAKTMALIAGRE